MVIFRECNLNFNFFFRFCTDQLFFKSWNERSWTDCQRIVFSFSTFKSFSVYKSFKIKDNFVFILYRTSFYCDCSCVLKLFFLKLSVDFFLCYAVRIFRNFDSFVFAKFYFRLCSYFSCEDERFSFFDLCYIDLRLRYDLKSAFIVCFWICFRNQSVCCIIIEDFRSVHLFDELARNFSFTESRNINSAFLFLVCFLKCSF